MPFIITIFLFPTNQISYQGKSSGFIPVLSMMALLSLYQFCQSSGRKGYLHMQECWTPENSVILLTNFFTIINLTLLTLIVKLQYVSPVSCWLPYKVIFWWIESDPQPLSSPCYSPNVFQIVLCSLRTVKKESMKWSGVDGELLCLIHRR